MPRQTRSASAAASRQWLSAPWLAAVVYAGLLLVAGMLATPAQSQPTDDATQVRALELQLEALRRDADSAQTVDERGAVIARVKAAQERAQALQSRLAPPIAQTEKRIAQLGADAAQSQDAGVREQHQQLNNELQAQVALARRAALSELEASQAMDRLSQAQVRSIGKELLQRNASPLTVSLWTTGYAALRSDLAQPTQALAPAERAPITLSITAWAVLIALMAAMVWLARPVLRALERGGMRVAHKLSGRDVRFARSIFAIWATFSGALFPTVALLLLSPLVNAVVVDERAMQFTLAAITAIVIGFYFRAAVQAVLQPAKPYWRLWRVSNPIAVRGARAGDALALAIVLIIAIEAAADMFKVSPATLALLHSALALVSTALLACALFNADRMRQLAAQASTTGDHDSRGQTALWAGLGWIATAALALFGALGYVNLANRISQWAIWAAVVFLATYLLMRFVDGLCNRLSSSWSASSQHPTASLPLRQASVLLSAVCQLLLLALACGAVLVPFGAGFTSVLGLLGPLVTGFEIGGVTVSAAAVLRAIAAFVIVMALFRFLRSWITHSYFPTTGLQADARDSIDKIVHYAGIVLAILWALTAFGIAMEKVAILASALSVGIGFGLQAITQNFVSGLILLVERPVRIGDWVKVNDVEGDIRRINVRSTEIRVGDHSTMIVPNSELITKVVQNKTMGHSLGRAQILLSVPLDMDLDLAIASIASTLTADEEVLSSPAPAVFVDRVEAGMAVLNCLVHVSSPRAAYSVRSRLLLSALRDLRARGIPVVLPAQQFSSSAG